MMTALEHLTLARCKKLKTLPASITHLSRLQKLWILEVPMEDMPCIEALTALHELRLLVTDYAHGSRAFTALSRSLPCLQQLQVLRFQASEVYDGSEPLVGAEILACAPQSVVLVDGGAPAVLASAPHSVMLADGGAPAVLALLLSRLCSQMEAPPQSLHWLFTRSQCSRRSRRPHSS